MLHFEAALIYPHDYRDSTPVYARAAEIVKGGRLGDLAAVNLSSLTHIDRVSWWARSEIMGAFVLTQAGDPAIKGRG